MKILKVETPNFKIDGGAYFGVVPKIIWEKQYPADSNNMCNASCRSLLIDDGNRIYLIDTGIGDKIDNNQSESYFIDYTENLEKNIIKIGYTPKDITDVILTHLHFDHCGGTTKINNITNSLELTFYNATHYVSLGQWQNAINPNYREKSSYSKKNFEILTNSKQLVLVENDIVISNDIELRIFNGHTQGLLLPVIKSKKQTIFFAGDLIPAKASIPLAWISAYDTFPLISIEEKSKILQEAFDNNWILFFQHDYYVECCNLQKTNKGIRAKDIFSFSNISL